MNPAIVGFSGNITRPSKTRALVSFVTDEIRTRLGLTAETYDVDDLGTSFPIARSAVDLADRAQRIVRNVTAAEMLVVGSPTYKGSYTGLFKHFFDLLDPAALRGKPVVLLATGGGDRHALIVEHQLRPLFGFFEALSLPTAIYAADRDFTDGRPASESLRKRIAQSVEEAGSAIARHARSAVAAE